MAKQPETTTLEVEREMLQEALKGAVYYIGQRRMFLTTDSERRDMNHIMGLFDELIDELELQKAKEGERA